MQILDHLMSTLNFNTPVQDIRQGVFYTAVLSRNCGLSATLPREALLQKMPLVQSPGGLMEQSAEQLARMAYSQNILEASMGVAAINSLFFPINGTTCEEINAADVIRSKAEGKRVAVVGHFPFVAQLKRVAKSLWVIEKNPQPGDIKDDYAAQLLPLAEVVAISGATLINHTLDDLLARCDPTAFVIVLGPTTPLSTILFEYGVDAISGTHVIDARSTLQCIAQGANYRQIKGVRRLTLFKDNRN